MVAYSSLATRFILQIYSSIIQVMVHDFQPNGISSLKWYITSYNTEIIFWNNSTPFKCEP